MPGATYSYCDKIAPGETNKTCRDIGATLSFKGKVQNNDIWQIHQRAYKKYYARVLKKTMSKADFEQWARNAEGVRDAALDEYEGASIEEKRQIAERIKKELN